MIIHPASVRVYDANSLIIRELAFWPFMADMIHLVSLEHKPAAHLLQGMHAFNTIVYDSISYFCVSPRHS